MTKTNIIEVVLVAIVLLTAAYLRMGRPGIVEFKRDEANLSLLALDFAHGGDLPLLGIGSSVGVPNAPVNVYLLAIPYWFSNSPLVATQFIGLLNVIAVALVYGFVRRYCGIHAAFAAALIFAISPWSLIFSRKIWAQNMLPVFAVLTVLSGVLGFIHNKRWAQAIHIPLLVITGQIHYAAFVLLPTSLYLLWYGRKHLSRLLVVSIIIGAILAAPFALGIMQAGLSNLGRVIETLPESEDNTITFTTKAVGAVILMTSGTEIHSLAGPEKFQAYLDRVPPVYPLFLTLAGLMLLSTLWLIFRTFQYRDARTPIDLVLLLWLIAPVLLFSFTWTTFYIHYLIPALPAVFVIIGFALHDWWRAFPQKIVFAGLYSFMGLVLVLQLWLWFALLDFVDSNYTPNGFGTPLHYLLDVRDTLVQHSPEHIIGDLGAQALIYDDEPTIWAAILYDLPSVRFQDRKTDVYPQHTTLVLSNDCQIEGERYLLRPDEGCYMIYPRAGFSSGDFEPLSQKQFNNGVQIIGYQWDQACLRLAWGITRAADKDYMFAVHFLDSSGQRVASADGLSWFGQYWHPGDQIVREFCLTQRDDTIVSVQIGMYTYDGTQFSNVDLVDGTGHSFEIRLKP